MSDDNNSNPGDRQRRGSISTFFFGNRPNGSSTANTPTAPQPIATPAAPPRRMSISTLGLSGTSPKQTPGPFFPRDRRASISTAGSDSIDESAIDDDADMTARSVPTSPFTRRMSFGAQAMFSNSRGAATGTSPTSSGRHPPLPSITAKTPHNHSSPPSSFSQASSQPPARSPSDHPPARSADGLNWSEQFRSRAESAVHHRPSFGAQAAVSPAAAAGPQLQKPFPAERAKSIGDMPQPPAAMPERAQAPPPQRKMERRKPDEVGERMLRGEFLMD